MDYYYSHRKHSLGFLFHKSVEERHCTPLEFYSGITPPAFFVFFFLTVVPTFFSLYGKTFADPMTHVEVGLLYLRGFCRNLEGACSSGE